MRKYNESYVVEVSVDLGYVDNDRESDEIDKSKSPWNTRHEENLSSLYAHSSNIFIF